MIRMSKPTNRGQESQVLNLAVSKSKELINSSSDLAVARWYREICKIKVDSLAGDEWINELTAVDKSDPVVVAKAARSWFEFNLSILQGIQLRDFLMGAVSHLNSINKEIS